MHFYITNIIADMTQYFNIESFNIAVLAIFGLGMLAGFKNGVFKTAFYFCFTLVVITCGWFLLTPLANLLLDINISKIGIITNGTEIFTARQLIIETVVSSTPELSGVLVEGTHAYTFIFSAVLMIAKLVALLLIIILNFTIFKFIAFIIYQFVKPKKEEVVDGQRIRRAKKSLLNRFMGALVGLLSSMFMMLILCTFISGMSSIGLSLGSAIPEEPSSNNVLSNSNNRTFSVIIGSNKIDERNEIITIEDSQNNDQSIKLPEEIKELEQFLEFMNGYRDSIAGKIYGAIKIGGTPIDYCLFDSVFFLENNKSKVSIRSELDILSKIIKTVYEVCPTGVIDIAALINLEEAQVKELFEEVSKLKIINVLIPVGLEIAIMGGAIQDGDTTIPTASLESVLNEIMELDLQSEITKIGYVVFEGLTILKDYGDVATLRENLLNLDGDKVAAFFNALGEVELIDVVGNAAVKYLLESDSITELLANNGIYDYNVNLENISISKEIKNFGEIYKALSKLGINLSATEENDYSKLFGEGFNQENVSALSTALFNSDILNSNSVILMAYVKNILPEEIKDTFNVVPLEANDLTNIFCLAKVFLDSNAFGENASFDKLLTDDNIGKIAKYISHSAVLSNIMSGLMNTLLEGAGLPNGLDITIPDGFVWSGNTGETEIKAMLNGMKVLIVDLKIGSNEFSFEKLTSADFDKITRTLTSSRILMTNAGNVLNYTINNVNLPINITIEEPDGGWDSGAGRREVTALLKSVDLLLKKSGNINEIIDLKSEEIDIILGSATVTRALVDLVKDNAVGENAALDITEVSDDDWYDKYNNITDERIADGELRKFLNGIKLLVPSGSTSIKIDVDMVLDNLEKDIHKLFESEILAATIKREINKILDDSSSLGKYVDKPQGGITAYQAHELAIVIKRLNDVGIKYNNLSYDSFRQVINGNQTKALKVSEAILYSLYMDDSYDWTKLYTKTSDFNLYSSKYYTLLESSLTKMITIFINSTDDINTRIGVEGIADYSTNKDWLTWRGWSDYNPSNSAFVPTKEDNTCGELYKTLIGLSALDSFDKLSSASDVDYWDNDLRGALKDMNESSFLRGILEEVISEVMTFDSEWIYRKTDDPLTNERKKLSKSDWNSEIDVIINIKVEIMNGLDVEALAIEILTETQIVSLEKVLKEMAKSWLLNINAVKTPLNDSLAKVFTGTTSNLGSVYEEVPASINYNHTTKIDLWAGDNAEIDILIDSIRLLNQLHKNGAYPNSIITNLEYCRNFGKFIDCAEKSKLLNPMINSILDKAFTNSNTKTLFMSLIDDTKDNKYEDAFVKLYNTLHP